MTLDKRYEHSVEGVCSLIWDIEKEFDLFHQQDKGVYFWNLVRFPLYYNLVQQIGVFNTPHPSYKFNFKRDVVLTLQILTHSLLHHPLWGKKTYKFAVVPHTRKVNGRDIYSEELLSSLDKEQTLLLYKSLQGGLHTTGYNVLLDRLSMHCIDFILGRTHSLSPDNAALIKNIEGRVKSAFPVTLNLKKLTEKRISAFKQNTKLYQYIFTKKKIETLFVIIGYSCHAAVHAAHLCGIKVTELQHGTISKYHLGYSFPVGGDHIPYFPDRMLCFGQFWIDYTPLPQLTETGVIGAPYIDEMLGPGSTTNKKDKTIVFASQGVIGKELLPFALKCAALLPDYHFIYRLHPSENEGDYTHITIPQNFTFSTKKPDIFTLLREAEFHAGVFSTTLIEGMVLGCRTIVIKMPGYEYMLPIIEAGDALLIHTPEEFAEKIEKAPSCKDSRYYYGEKDPEFSWV